MACCDSWGRKELDMTEQLNCTMYIIDSRWLVGGCYRAQEALCSDDLEGWDVGGGLREGIYVHR